MLVVKQQQLRTWWECHCLLQVLMTMHRPEQCIFLVYKLVNLSICACRCTVSVNDLDAYATGCHLSSFIWSSTAPKPCFEASVEIFVGFDGSKNVRTGSVATVSFNFFHSLSCPSVHSNTMLCYNNSLRHPVSEVRFGMNLPRKFIIPMALSTPFLSVGVGMSTIACTFDWSGLTPSLVNLSPKKVFWVTPNRHFSLLSFNSFFLTLCKFLQLLVMLQAIISPDYQVIIVDSGALQTFYDGLHRSDLWC